MPALNTESFYRSGGDTGILLLHGYTAATPEVRPMGEFLADKGLTVTAPLLPGHGTNPQDLNTRTWRELVETASSALYDLQGQCSKVYVGGLSMGGLLTLHLGQHFSGIDGLIPMAPALYLRDPMRFFIPLVKHFVPLLPKSKDLSTRVEDPQSYPLLWHYEQNPLHFADEVVSLMHHVRDRLSSLTQPLLVFHGAQDKTIPLKAAQVLMKRCSSRDKELVILPHSGHCLSVDGEREEVFAKTWSWIQRQNNSQ